MKIERPSSKKVKEPRKKLDGIHKLRYTYYLSVFCVRLQLIGRRGVAAIRRGQIRVNERGS